MDNPTPADPLDEVVRASGISYPNGRPYSHISFCLVAWNEEERLGKLLELMSLTFASVLVSVQKSDDRTLEIARKWATFVSDDGVYGYGDATFGPKLLPHVETKWTFKLDADEWPSLDLLSSLSNATWFAEHHGYDGIWIPFRSSVEGIEYEEQHAHLRLFETRLGWPEQMHSRPKADRMMLWDVGHIRHDRSLDEMMQDYLRYWEAGSGNAGWEDHNRLMMYHACLGTAGAKGWSFVQSHPWWPKVEAIAFSEEKPWQVSPSSRRPRSRSSRSAAST